MSSTSPSQHLQPPPTFKIDPSNEEGETSNSTAPAEQDVLIKFLGARGKANSGLEASLDRPEPVQPKFNPRASDDGPPTVTVSDSYLTRPILPVHARRNSLFGGQIPKTPLPARPREGESKEERVALAVKWHTPHETSVPGSEVDVDIIMVYVYDGTQSDAHLAFFTQHESPNPLAGDSVTAKGKRDGNKRLSAALVKRGSQEKLDVEPGVRRRATDAITNETRPTNQSSAVRPQNGAIQPSPTATSSSKPINWLNHPDMLPRASRNSRIICAGYDIASASNKRMPIDYEQAAADLVTAISIQRSECPNRAILYLAHGLGCRIVQHALSRASKTRLTASHLVTSCAGVLFCHVPSDHVDPRVVDLQSRSPGVAEPTLYPKTTATTDKRKSCAEEIERLGLCHFTLTREQGHKDDVIFGKDMDRSVMRFSGPRDRDFQIISVLVSRLVDTHVLLSAATSNDKDKVAGLIDRGIDISLQGKDGCTALHCAARSRDAGPRMIRLLLGKGQADVSMRDRIGRTALHYAVLRARSKPSSKVDNRVEIVLTLLSAGADIHAEDIKEISPWKLVQKSKDRKQIADLFKKRPLVEGPSAGQAADNEVKPAMPHSPDAEKASKIYQMYATEMYLDRSIPTNCTEKHLPIQGSIWEFVYGKDSLQTLLEESRRSDFKEELVCRWYHLPENNMAWIEDLFLNRFRTRRPLWGGHVRDSKYPHGRCIIPHAERFKTSINGSEETVLAMFMPYLSYEVNTRQTDMREHTRSSDEDKKRRYRILDGYIERLLEQFDLFKASRDVARLEGSEHRDSLGPGSWPTNTRDSSPDSTQSRSDGGSIDDSHTLSVSPQTTMDPDMSEAEDWDAVDESKPPKLREEEKMLLSAYVDHTSPLHIRRTLDQSYYYMLSNTDQRDGDQVVTRWADKHLDKRVHNILMVDQLWIWVIKGKNGADRVISSFPDRWGVESGDMDDLQRNVLNLNVRDRAPILSATDLVSRIVATCSSIFDRSQKAELVKFLQFFESTVGDVGDKEIRLLEDFREKSEELHQLSERHWGYQNTKNELLNQLLDIREETTLLKEVKDIRDEIKIILDVLEQQRLVLTNPAVKEFFDECPGADKNNFQCWEGLRIIQSSISNFTKMEAQAKDIHDALNHLLDLKQKQSNVWEARSAREGAEETSRQGNVMVVFTMVTIIFLPLSFMASFFALNVAEFPSDDRGDVNWPLHQVASLLFGLSFAVSIPFILMAFSVGFVRTMYHWILNSWITRMLVLGLKWVPLLRNTTFTRMAEKWSEDATQRQWEYTHASKKQEALQAEDKEKETVDNDDDSSMNSERRKQYRRHVFGVLSDLATKQQQRLTRRPTNTAAVNEPIESKV